jgi:hypothetical protein
MSRRDKIHFIVRKALEKEGWIVTHDPFFIKLGKKSAEIDLGAEKIVLAEKGVEKIAVEIKSFIGTSTITDFYHAHGQFDLYDRALKAIEPERVLYLALPDDAYEELKNDLFDFPNFEDLHHRIIVYKSIEDTNLLWIK